MNESHFMYYACVSVSEAVDVKPLPGSLEASSINTSMAESRIQRMRE